METPHPFSRECSSSGGGTDWFADSRFKEDGDPFHVHGTLADMGGGLAGVSTNHLPDHPLGWAAEYGPVRAKSPHPSPFRRSLRFACPAFCLPNKPDAGVWARLRELELELGKDRNPWPLDGGIKKTKRAPATIQRISVGTWLFYPRPREIQSNLNF